MPLASLFSLQFYGTGAMAAHPAGGGDVPAPTASATLHARARLDAFGAAGAFSPLARATQGRALAAVGTVVLSAVATLRARARLGAVGKVNELSQDDVSGAVQNLVIEGSLTLRDAMRLVLAVATGKTTGFPLAPRFRDLADSKDRIVGAVDANGNRTAVALDPS